MGGSICKQKFIFKVEISDNMLFLCQTVVFCFCFALSRAGFGCGCCSGLLVVNGTFSRPSLSEGQFTFMVI